MFWVDWREQDEDIVAYCEGVLRTGDLSAEVVDVDAEPGFEMYVSHRDKRVRVPFVVGTADRHITLCTLNEVLQPVFEIRACVDSNGSDSLAFLPLSCADWALLESRYGDEVGRHFRKITERPNLFTEVWTGGGPENDRGQAERPRKLGWLRRMFGGGA